MAKAILAQPHPALVRILATLPKPMVQVASLTPREIMPQPSSFKAGYSMRYSASIYRKRIVGVDDTD
ncbi:hypothetical protein T484DRAFT_1801193 [Baffinella frigidus]|nr:hypothetical protein T484DRAFT_1801193 [Cryptophyta sp. CCMP2293]